ncbi:sensory neuron membrane protein 1-like [Cloeon dipterum]|uniref:sensory neuron membrane protein 1-like n=1 Tax=Cloeon dipterum TaxID=197152 RepID=UPI00321FF31C
MCTKIVIAGSVSGLGVILVALGAGLGWGLFPSIIEDEVIKNIVLTNTSMSYENWQKLPQPMEFQVHIMEVENPEEVHSTGAKPKMREKGPYVYLEYKEKENIQFSEDGNIVEYEQRTFFEYSPELSGPTLSEDDEVSVLNAALMGVLLTPDIEDDGVQLTGLAAGFNFLFDNPESVFTKVKVRDLLFDGILIKCQGSEAITANIFWKFVCIEMKRQFDNGLLPPAIRYDDESKNFFYSFFYHKSNKTDGHFKVLTGKTDVKKVGEIVEWEYEPTLKFWSGDECNAIKGSDATIFSPFMDKETKIYVFATDLCRSIYLSYDKEISHEGISGYRYVVDALQLGNLSSRPENYCFCPPNGACLKEGAMDLFPCFNGPVILSMPHFYQAPDYEIMVENLTPSKEKHQIYLDIETLSGAPLGAGRRVQFNMMIKKIRNFDITKNLPVAVVPLIWVNEGLTLNEENTNLLKDELISKLIIVDGVRWGLIGVGCAVFVAGAALFFVWRGSFKKPSKKQTKRRRST